MYTLDAIVNGATFHITATAFATLEACRAAARDVLLPASDAWLIPFMQCVPYGG